MLPRACAGHEHAHLRSAWQGETARKNPPRSPSRADLAERPAIDANAARRLKARRYRSQVAPKHRFLCPRRTRPALRSEDSRQNGGVPGLLLAAAEWVTIRVRRRAWTGQLALLCRYC